MKNYLHKIFNAASDKLEYLKGIKLTFDVPKNEDFGDYSSNAAMLLSRQLKKSPKVIAQEIIDNLNPDSTIIRRIEIAGNGFINFYFTPYYISNIIQKIIAKSDTFGKSDRYSGKKANVEFVSANPTGPLTVGHGRNAVCGDIIANLLEWVGYTVIREYYFNNAGRQMRRLGDSVRLRYLELIGEKIEFPEDYYQGDYISDIAKNLFEEFGNKLVDEDAEGKFKETAEAEIFQDIKNTLSKTKIYHDIYFNENTLYQSGRIEGILNLLKSKGLSYEKDGAVWLKLSEMGREVDKVIIKSTGEPTYRLPDVAYHIDKFERGYDLLIDIFGSDHGDTYPDIIAALNYLGYDVAKLKVLIHQFVTIIEDGKVVKMSTRKANYITLEELIDEVGVDAVRYFFIMRGLNSHLNFDLKLAKEKSEENPVFYVQYAHARICSILRAAEENSLKTETQNLKLLIHPDELRLLKLLQIFEEELLAAAETCDPQRISSFLESIASAFHRFYTSCRIMGVEKELSEARLSLIYSVKIVIVNGLSLLGVSAPTKM